jgi:YacP-like NYN domain
VRHDTPVAIVLVDAENVRRSTWPNIPEAELGRLCANWAKRHGHDVRVIWEAAETADDRIAREVEELEGPVWVVTSDRGLRERVQRQADRIVGGGSFARELTS